MMFASDLDRTLIYSKRAIEEFPSSKIEFKAVEVKDSKPIAFMTAESYQLLFEIARNILFVPITSRSNTQYQRLTMFKDLPLLYSVTANGAHIFYKGERIIEWQEMVKKRLSQESASYHELSSILTNTKVTLQGIERVVDDLFVYYILNDPLSKPELKKIQEAISSIGWRISQQGKRLYMVPNPICKGEALNYIKKREGIKTVIGAGDSLLDQDFLQYCQFRFVPKHGELAELKLNLKKYFITNTYGIEAGEEILKKITSMLSLTIN